MEESDDFELGEPPKLYVHDRSDRFTAASLAERTTAVFGCLTLTFLYGPDENGIVWARVRYPANTEVPDHADTDLLQFVEVASGSIVLNTAAGDLVLEEGDTVCLEPGLSHAWRTGDLAASLTVFAFVPGRSEPEGALSG
jgi:quercetin dioxygenase-like cupin family protein